MPLALKPSAPRLYPVGLANAARSRILSCHTSQRPGQVNTTRRVILLRLKTCLDHSSLFPSVCN